MSTDSTPTSDINLRTGDALLFDRNCKMMAFPIGWFVCENAKKRGTPYDHVGPVVVYSPHDATEDSFTKHSKKSKEKNKKTKDDEDSKKNDNDENEKKTPESEVVASEPENQQQTQKTTSKIVLKQSPLISGNNNKKNNNTEIPPPTSSPKPVDEKIKDSPLPSIPTASQDPLPNCHVASIFDESRTKVVDAVFRGVIIRPVADAMRRNYNDVLLLKMLLVDSDSNPTSTTKKGSIDFDGMLKQAKETDGNPYKRAFVHFVAGGLAAYPDRREAALSYSSALMRRRLRNALLIQQQEMENKVKMNNANKNNNNKNTRLNSQIEQDEAAALAMLKRRLQHLEIEESSLLKAYQARRARLEHSSWKYVVGLNNHHDNKRDGYFCSEVTSSVLQAGDVMADFPAATSLTPSDFAWQTEAGSFPLVQHSFNPDTCYTPMIQIKPGNSIVPGSNIENEQQQQQQQKENKKKHHNSNTAKNKQIVMDTIDREMKRRSFTSQDNSVEPRNIETGEVFWFDENAGHGNRNFVFTGDLHCALVEEELPESSTSTTTPISKFPVPSSSSSSSGFWSSILGLFSSSNNNANTPQTSSSNKSDESISPSPIRRRPAPISWLASPPANAFFLTQIPTATSSTQNTTTTTPKTIKRRGILARSCGTLWVGTSVAPAPVSPKRAVTHTLAPSATTPSCVDNAADSVLYRVTRGNVVYRGKSYKEGDVIGMQELLSRYLGVFPKSRFQGWENELHREMSANRLLCDPERSLLVRNLAADSCIGGASSIKAGMCGAEVEELSASQVGEQLINALYAADDGDAATTQSASSLALSLFPPSLVSFFRTTASSAVGDSDFLLTPREAGLLLGGDNSIGDRKMVNTLKMMSVSVVKGMRPQHDSSAHARIAELNDSVARLKSQVLKWILFQGRAVVRDSEADPLASNTSSSANINPKKKGEAIDNSKLVQRFLDDVTATTVQKPNEISQNKRKRFLLSWDSPCVEFNDVLRASKILRHVDESLENLIHQNNNNNNNSKNSSPSSFTQKAQLSTRQTLFVDIVLRPLVQSMYYSKNSEQQQHHHHHTLISIVDEINDELKFLFDSFDSETQYVAAADHRVHSDIIDDPANLVDRLLNDGELQLGPGSEKVISALRSLAKDNAGMHLPLLHNNINNNTNSTKTGVLRCLDARLGGECNDISQLFLSGEGNMYHQQKMEENLKLRYVVPRLWLAVLSGAVASAALTPQASHFYRSSVARPAPPATSTMVMVHKIQLYRAFTACLIHTALLSIAIKIYVHYSMPKALRNLNKIQNKNDKNDNKAEDNHEDSEKKENEEVIAPKYRRWQLLKIAAATGFAAALATYPFEAAVARVIRNAKSAAFKNTAATGATTASTTTSTTTTTTTTTMPRPGSSQIPNAPSTTTKVQHNLFSTLSTNLRYWKRTSYRGIFPWSVFALSPYVGSLQWLYIHEFILPLGFIAPSAAPSFLFPTVFDSSPSFSASSSSSSSSSSSFDYLSPFSSSTFLSTSAENQARIHRTAFVGIGLTFFLAVTHPIEYLRFRSLSVSNKSVGGVFAQSVRDQGFLKAVRACYGGFLTSALPRHVAANIASYTIFGIGVKAANSW